MIIIDHATTRAMCAVVLTVVIATACSSPTAAPAASAAPSKAAASPATKPSGPSQVTPLAQRAKLKVSLNPAIVTYLPLLIAIDKGYFENAGLDIDLATYQGSSVTQIPLLARGDLDIAGVSPAPALFNQVEQGFNAKIIASLGVPKAGRLTDAWLTVLKDKAGDIKQVKDLKGKTIDAAAEGTPIHLLATEAVRQAGLTVGQDVTLSFRGRTVPDQIAVVKAKAADVVGMVEPAATQNEKAGDIVRWITYSDIVPWYSSLLIAASDSAIQRAPEAIQKFLEVYVLTSREINLSNGQWAQDVVGISAKRAGVDAKVITDQGGVPYYEPNGTASKDSLQKAQDIWVREKQVRTAVDVNRLIDVQLLQRAIGVIGFGN